MSRNGSGTYSLPVNSWNPATNGVSATPADWQSLIDDVEAALTQSVSKDGQTTMTGNLPMGGFKLTGLAAGAATGQSLRWEQLFAQGTEADIASATTTTLGTQNSNFLRVTGTTTITSFGTTYNGPRFLRFEGALTLTHSSTLILPTGANITTAAGDLAIAIPKATLGTPDGWYVFYQRADGTSLLGVTPAQIQAQTYTAFTTAGTSSAYTLTPVPAISAYAENQEFDVEFNAASTGTPTINISAVGAKALKFRLPGGTLVTCGTLIPSGWRSKVTYDGTDMIVREMPLSAATPAVGTAAGTAGATGTASDAGHAHPPMSGSVIQKVTSTDATVLGPLSGSIPADDTIPQSSEGDLVFSFPAFTPKSASSTLVIHVNLWGSTSSSFAYPTWAVFNSGSANAIGAGRGWPDNGSGNAGGIAIIAKEASASTSARTYTVRVGISGGNWYINGNTTGTRRFGGVSFIVGTIGEIAA